MSQITKFMFRLSYHNPPFLIIYTNRLVSSKTGDTSGPGTVYLSRADVFATGFYAVRFVFTPFLLLGVHIILMTFIFIYVYMSLTRFPFQMMFKSFNSNMTDAISSHVYVC